MSDNEFDLRERLSDRDRKRGNGGSKILPALAAVFAAALIITGTGVFLLGGFTDTQTEVVSEVVLPDVLEDDTEDASAESTETAYVAGEDDENEPVEEEPSGEEETVEEEPEETETVITTSVSVYDIDDTYSMWSTTDLNVRAGPGTEFGTVGALGTGDEVTVTGESSNGWLRIEFDGSASGTGYVYKSYMSYSEIERAETAQDVKTDGSEDGTEDDEPEWYEIAEGIDGAEAEYVELANEYLAKVPENVMEAFINQGWSLYVTGEDIATEYYDEGVYTEGTVWGATFYAKKMIVVEASSHLKYCLIHEIGHFVDYVNGQPSQSGRWSDIYEEEVEEFKETQKYPSAVSNEAEFFAQVFSALCTDPDDVPERAAKFVTEYYSQL